jgi:glucose/arabinose dehydrogenase
MPAIRADLDFAKMPCASLSRFCYYIRSGGELVPNIRGTIFPCRSEQLMRFSVVLLLMGAVTAAGAVLPGFRVQRVAVTSGFADSIVTDSRNTIYYTTQDGNLWRFSNGASEVVTHVNTVAIGNSGLLGLALRDDNTAIVHYTTPGQTYDVISSVDLTAGTETLIHPFACDAEAPGRPSSSEHHGGNPIVAPDGSIFVGLGDFFGSFMAPLPEWNGGKIFKIFPDRSVQQFARGFRNPFDISWDDANQRLIVPDNGDSTDDEINIIHLGEFAGWPDTAGNSAPVDGSVSPIYVFPVIVAPTGIAALNHQNSYFPSGYLLGGFVSRAIYYIPNIDARPLPDPIAVISAVTDPIVDVTIAPNGNIYFLTGNAIYQLIPPLRGDCNGDGVVDAADIAALELELRDGNPESILGAEFGLTAGSWGCDVNGDGIIDSRDLALLESMVPRRLRAVRGH